MKQKPIAQGAEAKIYLIKTNLPPSHSFVGRVGEARNQKLAN